jgi:hypothetical protein
LRSCILTLDLFYPKFTLVLANITICEPLLRVNPTGHKAIIRLNHLDAICCLVVASVLHADRARFSRGGPALSIIVVYLEAVIKCVCSDTPLVGGLRQAIGERRGQIDWFCH